jgi:hypothetical protein
VVVDGHAQVVFSVGDLAVKSDVFNLNVAKLIECVGDTTRSAATSPWPSPSGFDCDRCRIVQVAGSAERFSVINRVSQTARAVTFAMRPGQPTRDRALGAAENDLGATLQHWC